MFFYSNNISTGFAYVVVSNDDPCERMRDRDRKLQACRRFRDQRDQYDLPSSTRACCGRPGRHEAPEKNRIIDM